MLSTPVASENQGLCNQAISTDIYECEFKLLFQSDSELNNQMKLKTFDEWEAIRLKMCDEAYREYREATNYTNMILICSIEMNRTLLKKIGRLI